jgi:hypothetical protein
LKSFFKNVLRTITILSILTTFNLGFDLSTSKVYAAPNSENFESQTLGWRIATPITIGDWRFGFIKGNGDTEQNFSDDTNPGAYVEVANNDKYSVYSLGSSPNKFAFLTGYYAQSGTEDEVNQNSDKVATISSKSGEKFKLISFKIEDGGGTGNAADYVVSGYRDGVLVSKALGSEATWNFRAPYGQTTTVKPFENNSLFDNIDEFRIQYLDGSVGVNFLIDDIVLGTTTPTASLAGSTIKSGTNITLTSETGATIYYTTGINPTDPTTSSNSVASGGSIAITGNPGETIKVKALAVNSGKENSTVSTFTYTIQPKQTLTVTGITAQNKQYDGTTTAILTGTAALSGTIQSGDKVTLSGTPTAQFATKDVGDGKAVTVSGYTLTGADAAYYDLTQPTGLTADITKKDVSISGITSNSKSYDGTTTATLNLSAENFSGKIEGDDLTIDTSSASVMFADASVGTGKTVNVSGLKLGGTDKDNYNLSNSSFTLTADINAVNPVLSVSTDGIGNISINGGSNTPSKTESYPLGTVVTLTAIETDSTNSPFMHWVDGNNSVVSDSKEYTFILKKDTNLKAVFSTKTDNTHLVVFKNGNNNEIIQRVYVDKTATTVLYPADPYMYGYKFNGWDKDSTAIQANNGDVEVTAEFTKDATAYNVTVNDGTITAVNAGTTSVNSGTYDIKDYVVVTANSATTGQQFSHWEDSNGNIVCYDTNYKFYVSSDVTLTAKYVSQGTTVEKKASIGVIGVKDANNISFITQRIVPDGCSLVSHGIIVTKDGSLTKDTFEIGATGVFKSTATTTGLLGTYIVTIGNVPSGQTRYARGYAIYKDSKGNEFTLYSDISSETM